MIRAFFRNAGVMAGAELVARLKGLLILPLLTRYLGALDFGVWSQVSMVVLTLSPLISLGMENGLVRLLPGQRTDRQYRQYLAWVVIALSGAIALATLLEVGGGAFSKVFFAHAGYEDYMTLAAASLIASSLPNLPRTWFRLQNDGATLALATILQALLSIAVMLGAVLTQADLERLILLALLADIILGAAFLAWILVRMGWARPDFSIVAPALKFGVPLLPAAYAIWGLNWVDRLFLVQYHSLHDIGIYAAAYGIGYAVIQIFVNPIWMLYPNTIAQLHNQRDPGGVDRLLHLTVWAILLFSMPAITGMWALGTPIMALVAGEGFQGGADIMWIIALAYLCLMLASFGDIALGLAFRQYWATVSIGLAFGTNLVLNGFLIPPFGILGAALATLAAFSVQLLFSTVMARRYGPFLREWRYMARLIVAAVIMALVVRSIDGQLITLGNLRLAILIPLGAAVYAGIVIMLRGIPDPVLAPARRWAGERFRRPI